MKLAYFIWLGFFLISTGHAKFKKIDLRGDVWPKPKSIDVDKGAVYEMKIEEIIYDIKSEQCIEMIDDLIRRYQSVLKIPFLHYEAVV